MIVDIFCRVSFIFDPGLVCTFPYEVIGNEERNATQRDATRRDTSRYVVEPTY
jgi:hypothetical protein